MASTSSESTPILNLYFCNGKILVWDHHDVAILRDKCRIIGAPFGCFPLKPRQNVQLGLPLMLSNIEGKFVLEHYNSQLINSTTLPTDSVNLQEYQENVDSNRKIQYEIQTKLKKDQKWNNLDEIADEIKKGKLKKQLQKSLHEKSVHQHTIGNDHESMSTSTGSYEDFEEFKKSELKKVERYGIEQTWVNMPIKSELNIKYPILQLSDISFSDEENLKYCVFCDLHYQGYYLTEGLKFGGDFLVYPGDPGLYHSIYIVFCIPYSKKLSATDYSSLGRLATSVKKTLLLCSVDDANQVVYSSFAWSGIV